MRYLRSFTALVLGASLTVLAPSPAGAVEGDEEGPTIGFTLPDNQIDGWWARSNMQIGVTVTDISGVGQITWTRSGTSGGTGTLTQNPGQVSVNTQGQTTVTVTATDGEGNTSTEAVTVGLDTTLPFVGVTGRMNDASRIFAQHEVVAVTYGCSDPQPGSGLASCEATVPSGGHLDTSTIGSNQTFSITATDNVGQTSTRHVSYSVIEPELTLTTPIELSGSGLVGDELTGSVPVFSPSATTVTYAWHRNGEPIPNAIGRTYTPRAEDVGEVLTLVATATRTAFDDARTESDPITVEPGVLAMSGDPELRGDPVVGEELTVDHPPAFPWAQTYTYHWIRDLETEIAVSDEPTYVLTPDDLGHHISVLVAVETPGYHDRGWFSDVIGPVTSAEQPPPPPATDLALVTSGAPSLDGTPVAGATLTATLPTITANAAAPGARVATAVEWLRNGQPIAGAAGTTYRLGAADVGHAISVRVTGSAPSHRTQSLTSPATAAVTKAASALRLTAVATKKGVRLTARASSPGLVPTGTVVVKVRTKVVARITLTNGAGTATVRGLRPGRVTLKAAYAGDGTVAATTAQKKVTVKKAKKAKRR